MGGGLPIRGVQLAASSECLLSVREGVYTFRLTDILAGGFVLTLAADLQIIITANKEAVISEKDFLARFGQTILTSYAEPIDAGKYGSFEDFLGAVQSLWTRQWQRVYGAQWSGAVADICACLSAHQAGNVALDLWQRHNLCSLKL